MGTDDYSGPCRKCASDVDIVDEFGERVVSDVGPERMKIRKCRNPECPTNKPGERSIADVV